MSTKFDPELPTMPFIVERNGLRAMDNWVLEKLDGVARGSEVHVKFYQKRSNPKLSLYWVILNLCVENSDGPYGTSEQLHQVLKVALGYELRTKKLNSNEEIVIPGSISFARMSEQEFSIYFDKAMAQLEMAGYPVSVYLKEGEKQHGRGQKAQSQYRRIEEDEWPEREEAA